MDKMVKDFGEFIKNKRIERGLSQGEAAKLIGISQAAYSRYELGHRDPGLNMMRAIAKALHFHPSEFFDGYMKRYAWYQERLDEMHEEK